MAGPKKAERDAAIALRLQGLSYNEILERVPVSQASLSKWLRDCPLTDAQQARLRERRNDAIARRAAAWRQRRVDRQEATWAQARNEIPTLGDRELFIAGVVAYWAEGSKSKPWSRRERVTFLNSDPDLVRLFLRWLAMLGIGLDDIIFRINIHESADLEAANIHWRSVIGGDVPIGVTLKRHNPRTVRKNVGSAYFGCLTITVRRSTELYRRIQGWWEGIAAAVTAESDVSAGSIA